MDLKEKLGRGFNYAKRGAKNGFFHIFAGNTMVKCISALSVLLLPRILGQDNYGTLGYVDVLIGYLILINGFGISNALLRYCSAFDDPGGRKSYFSFSVKFGLLADLALIVIVGGFIGILSLFGITTPFYNPSYNSGYLLAALCLTPVFSFLFDCVTYFMRANRENKSFSKLSVIFTASYAVFQLILAKLFLLGGVVAGRYIAYCLTLVAAYLMLRKMPAFHEKASKISRTEKRGMIKFSLNSLLANAFSQVMPYNEGLIVGAMVSKADFADFRAAQVAPASIGFIALSVIVFAYPYFAKNYRDGNWIYHNAKKLFLGLSAFMAVITAAGIFLSPFIVKIYGSKFESGHAVLLMQIFFVTYGINGALRYPIGNILAAIGELRFNIYNAIFSSTVHVAICYLFVRSLGIYGAAYGLLSGYVISAIAGIVYLRYYCRKLEKKARQEQEQQPGELLEDEAS